MEIKPITIRRNVVEDLPQPATASAPPPVVTNLDLPIIEVPSYEIEYPTLPPATQQQYEEELQPPQVPIIPPTPQQEQDGNPSRDLPPPESLPVVDAPVINIGGVEVTLPPADVVATTGATAVIATSASLVAAVAVKQLVKAAEPIIKNAIEKAKPKKLKVKAKIIKPVLHYVMTDSGSIDIFQYSKEGTKIVDSTNSVEMYLRDQFDKNSLYDIQNKVIIDDVIKDKFTKEGKERFKKLFVPPAKIAKNLAAKFSF